MSEHLPGDWLVSPVAGQTTILHRNPERLEGNPEVADRQLEQYRDILAVAAPRLGPGQLHWLGHFVNGEVTFTVDVLDDEQLASNFSRPGFGPPGLRKTLPALGSRLNYDMSRVDKDLRPLRTGRLIRTIFDLGTTGVYWYWIHEKECLVGLTFASQHIDDADYEMSVVAEALLNMYGRSARDYGGFRRGISRHRASPAPAPWQPRVKRPLGAAAGMSHLVQQCAAAVDPRDLHYASLFVDGSWSLSADVFDAAAVTSNYGGVSASLRRSLLEQVGEQVQYDVAEFDRQLRPVARHRSDRLARTVFDVEAGAIYHYGLDLYRYLVAVTLFQNQVEYAEDRARELAEDLRATLGEASPGIA